jgi:D-lyxose ketol-isomerase
MLGGFAAGVAATVPILGTGCSEAAKPEVPPPTKPTLRKYKNEDFYGPDGKLNATKAKAAYYELMKHHKYPVYPALDTDAFWVLDFGLGKFTEVGMGGIFWINDQRDDYLLHDIWLLPNQMIPEHYHVKTDKVAAKMEAWLVRHGTDYFGSEGEPSPGIEEIIPPSHKECAKAKHVVLKGPGEVVKLEVAESRHWQKAGPEGAIVTEVATYHDMGALRFSHPQIKL